MRRNFSLAQPRRSSRWQQLINLMLIASGAFTLLARPNIIEMVRVGKINSLFVLLGPALFALFLVFFALMGIFSKRRNRQPISIATTFFGALLLAIIVPESLREYNARQSPRVASYEFFKDFLHSQDARVRALLIMSASCTAKSSEEWLDILESGLADKDPLVQEAAKHVISDKMGLHLGSGPQGLQSARNMLETWNSADFVAHKSIP